MTQTPVRHLLAAALLSSAACASYRALPIAASPSGDPAGAAPLPVRLEGTRLFLFSSVTEEVLFERIFQAPGGDGPLWVSTLAPSPGLLARPAGGGDFEFLPADLGVPRGATVGGPARLFAQVLFDPRNPLRAWGRRAGILFHTDDGGRRWSVRAPEGLAVEAVALTSEGTLIAAAGGALHLSSDGGRSWTRRAIRIAGVAEEVRIRVRSLLVDEKDPQALWVALRSDEATSGNMLLGLLDGSTELAQAARALVDDPVALPRAVHFGQGAIGLFGSRDGGVTWQRSGLVLDAWVFSADGALWALAADPMLEAARLVARHRELATALAQQTHGLRVDAASLRASLAWPGRGELLAGQVAVAPLFRSADRGETWARVASPEAALAQLLRARLEQLRAAAEGAMEPKPAIAREEPRDREGTREGGREGGRDGGRGGRGGGRGRSDRGGVEREPPRPERSVPPEALLTYLDPVRLLARFNGGDRLTSVAESPGGGLLAFAPTEAFWSRLADAAVAASDVEGEISLGPGAQPRDATLLPFDLFAAGPGGPLAPVPLDPALASAGPPGGGGTAAYPAQVAAERDGALLLLSARDRAGRPFRQLWRAAAGAATRSSGRTPP